MFAITEQVSIRLVIGVCFALLASACGGGRSVQGASSNPTAPSNPTAASNPVPIASYTITGVVADESGRPIVAASYDACCPGGFTYSHDHLHDVLLTDESGHFRMTGLPAGVRLWFRAHKDGYVQPCAAAPATVQGDLAIDLALVSSANLTATAQSAPGFRSVSGTVVEITPTGKKPAAGVGVWFEAFEDFEPASTYSDQAGRFALCGLPVDETVHLEAFVPAPGGGRAANAYVPTGQTTDVEIVLP
jgi:hypothetical protein